MSPTGEQLAAGISTGGRGLSAGEPDTGLAAGAEPVQREGAGGTGPTVADEVTGVVFAGQQFPTGGPALVLRAGAGPGSLGLPAAAALNAGLTTGPALARVTGLLALVRAAAQGLPAGPPTGPGRGVTPPGGGPAGAAVTGGGDRDGTGGAGAGVAQQQALVATPAQGPATQRPAAVGSLPGVPLGLSLLPAVTFVLLGDLTGRLASPALGAGPAHRLLLLSSLGVVLQLLLQQEYRVLGPSLDTGQVEAGVAVVAAVDGVRPLHGGDADETDGGVEGVLEGLHDPGHHLALDAIVLTQQAGD